MRFTQEMSKKRLLFDGGFGSMLYKYGMKAGELPELYNIQRPEVVADIHRQYAVAGADAVTTNTLGANGIMLKRHGLDDRLEEIVRAAVENAREGVGDGCFVALSTGPTGGMLSPLGDLSFAGVYTAYKRQAVAGAQAGADVIYHETMGDIIETRIAALAAMENTTLPVCCSFTYQKGKMLMGGTPECAALIFSGIGVDAVAANCSGEPEEMEEILRRTRCVSDIAFIAMPNAGMPDIVDGQAIYKLGADEMAGRMRGLLEGGAAGIGGCCGTTPEHIARFRMLVDGYGAAPAPPVTDGPYICSTRRYISLREALNSFGEIKADIDALYEIDDGISAAMIDITHMDAKSIEEFMPEVLAATHIPLCLRVNGDEQAETALRLYAGIAGVSGNCSEEILKKYGAIRWE